MNRSRDASFGVEKEVKRTGFLVALAMGALFGVAASAPAQFVGFGYGRGYHRSYSSLGFGYGGRGYARPTVVYRNPFTGDVDYAERASNDFRHDYEKRRHDPLGIKADVQRMDETLEKVRKEAEAYGGATDRGADLMREALDAEDRIDRRFRDSRDPMRRQWDDTRRTIDRLGHEYRVD